MKKIFNFVAVLTAISGLFFGCSDIEENEKSHELENISHKNEYAIENINSEIVLGDKIENIFTIEQVNARNAANGIEEKVEPNYIYFRCRTEDEKLQEWLSKKFDFLSIIPLDREILEGGTIYKDPELSEEECPWTYLMKPIEDYNEVVEQGLITEVLDEMYLDDEDIAILSGEGLEIPENTYLTVNVEDENSRGLWRRIKKFFKKYIANKPSGKVQVLDTVTGKYVPLKGVKVMSQQLGLFGSDITGKNGKFSISRAYTSLGGKVQIMLVFKNSNITVNDPEHLSNFFGSVVYYEDWHWLEGISDLNISVGRGQFNKRCATILNAYSDYCDYCDINKIIKPENLSIWTVSGTGGACTPLLRHMTGTALPSMTNSVSNFLGIPIPSLDKALIPDIIIGTKNANDDYLTQDIYPNMFHELSHASHYFGLGKDARKIWKKEYGDMLSGWIEVWSRGEKIADDCYNSGGTDLVKLIESWGYFSGNYIMAWKYPQSAFVNKELSVDYLNILEYRKLDTYEKDNKIVQDKSKPYFYYGGLYDLIDTANEKDVDFTSGYTYNQLFRALTSSNVTNLNTFANALVKVANRQSDLQNVLNTLEANHD